MTNMTIRHLPTLRQYGPNEWVEVPSLPKCDVCPADKMEAYYDARTEGGRWGYLCTTHFISMGCKLGLGWGQRLVLEGQYEVI